MTVAKGDAGAGSMVEAIADTLREGIRQGRYMAGQRLVEADITQEFSVSRGPLREALRRLAAEGLVDLQHHRGARVRVLTRREMADLQAVRAALESLAAATAAQRVAAGELQADRLLDLTERMEQALDDGAIARYLDCNQAFHDLLVDWSGNTMLYALVRQLQIPMFRLQTRAMTGVADLRLAQQDHRAIAAAVIAGSPDAAEAAMRCHIHRSDASARALPDEYFS